MGDRIRSNHERTKEETGMKNARPAMNHSHRAHRCARAALPTKSISPNPEDVKEKSQSIMNLDGPTDEQAIRDALRMLPAEYVRKVRIYATTLVEIFAQKM